MSRLSKSGPNGYPTDEDIEAFTSYVNGQIILQSEDDGTFAVVGYDGPLRLYLIHLRQEGSDGTKAEHYVLGQSWRYDKSIDNEIAIGEIVSEGGSDRPLHPNITRRLNYTGASTSAQEFANRFGDPIAKAKAWGNMLQAEEKREVKNIIF